MKLMRSLKSNEIPLGVSLNQALVAHSVFAPFCLHGCYSQSGRLFMFII